MDLIDKIREIKKQRKSIDIRVGVRYINAKYTREMNFELGKYHGLDVPGEIEKELVKELSKVINDFKI